MRLRAIFHILFLFVSGLSFAGAKDFWLSDQFGRPVGAERYLDEGLGEALRVLVHLGGIFNDAAKVLEVDHLGNKKQYQKIRDKTRGDCPYESEIDRNLWRDDPSAYDEIRLSKQVGVRAADCIRKYSWAYLDKDMVKGSLQDVLPKPQRIIPLNSSLFWLESFLNYKNCFNDIEVLFRETVHTYQARGSSIEEVSAELEDCYNYGYIDTVLRRHLRQSLLLLSDEDDLDLRDVPNSVKKFYRMAVEVIRDEATNGIMFLWNRELYGNRSPTIENLIDEAIKDLRVEVGGSRGKGMVKVVIPKIRDNYDLELLPVITPRKRTVSEPIAIKSRVLPIGMVSKSLLPRSHSSPVFFPLHSLVDSGSYVEEI